MEVCAVRVEIIRNYSRESPTNPPHSLGPVSFEIALIFFGDYTSLVQSG
jgi:hypothetical protein